MIEGLGYDSVPYTSAAGSEIFEHCVAGGSRRNSGFLPDPRRAVRDGPRSGEHACRPNGEGRAATRHRHLRDLLGSVNTMWVAEAAAFIAWRDAVWAQVFALRAQAVAGEIPTLPSGAELIASLPAMVWPASQE